MGDTRLDGSPADVLAQWREAERRIEEYERGSAEWRRARLDAEHLAAMYQELVAEREDEANDLVGRSPGDAIGVSPLMPPDEA